MRIVTHRVGSRNQLEVPLGDQVDDFVNREEVAAIRDRCDAS